MFILPNYKIENELYRQGYRNIAGLDEAGRGAWAGPVVAAAVGLPPKLKIKGLRDSKLLSPKQREELFVVIKKNALAIGVGIMSEKIIDSEGIIGATRRAFLAAAEKIKEQVIKDEKDRFISEDDKFKRLEELDALVKNYNETIREIGAKKEEEIMKI